jgi:hypothetical protein
MCSAMDNIIDIDFRLSRSLIMDVTSALGFLYSVLVGDVTEILEVPAVVIFRMYSEDGGGLYLRKVDNIAHNHTV